MKYLKTLVILILSVFSVPARAQADDSPYRPVIIQVEDDEAVRQLEEDGVVIWRQRGDMVLALVPQQRESSVRSSRGVRHMQRSRPLVMAMDTARTMFGADRIGVGENLPQPYDGTGVVVGLCDIGLDPGHVAFKDADGNQRVKKVVCMNEPSNKREIITDPSAIAEWTDDSDNYHGTHVANIMAGSYKPNKLYGMAPGADIVMTSSLGYDMGLLEGCEQIIDYAREVGKPAVINLSFSSYTGPKDGTSLFCRYMELLGREAIICLASGNLGDARAAFRMNFTETSKSWRGRIVPVAGLDLMGFCDAWSDDGRPIKTRVMVYEQRMENGKEAPVQVYESRMLGDNGPFSVTISSEKDESFGGSTKLPWINHRHE